MAGDKLIEVKNLSKEFHGKEVLKNISLNINKGDVVCLIGPSGSGKSTFLRCLNKLEVADSGEILFEGVDICKKDVNGIPAVQPLSTYDSVKKPYYSTYEASRRG